MKLRSITEQEFNSYKGCCQIIAEEYAQQFAALDLERTSNSYGLGWNSSEIIKPELELSPDRQTVWVGVNQHLVAIDLATGRIQLLLKLRSNLLEIIATKKFIAIRAETEVLLINPDFSILFTEDFSDITAEISISSDKLEIYFLEGYSLSLDLQTGSLSNGSRSQVTTTALPD